jgi:homoserine dehydrogenase
MSVRSIRIGICGLGTVGSGVFNIINRNAKEINARANCNIVVSQIGARRDHPNCETSEINVVRDIFAVVVNPDIDIVVELIGGTTVAYDLVMSALQNGKHVVTANKALIAEHGTEIFSFAESRGLTVAYEAAVAGGIPIVKALREGLVANRVNWMAGIINGTTNFILSEMDTKGRSFDDVLAEAQTRGYAEADPTFDIDGIDAAQKLVILASLAFGMPLSLDGLFTDGVSGLEPQDFAYARELGYVIKHLAIARLFGQNVELRVHPTLVPEGSLIAGVNNVDNAIMVNADAVGTTLFYGPGAGSEPTASSVIADIVDIARSICSDTSNVLVQPLGCAMTALEQKAVIDIREVDTSFYIRFSALDEPGVLSDITKIMGNIGISIKAIIQREQPVSRQYANVIVLTNITKGKLLDMAVEHIEQLETVCGNVNFIRVEHLS